MNTLNIDIPTLPLSSNGAFSLNVLLEKSTINQDELDSLIQEVDAEDGIVTKTVPQSRQAPTDL